MLTLESFIRDSQENGLLKDAQFAGTHVSGNVCVFYQIGLQNQAECIAKLTDKAFSHIKNSTGFHPFYDSFTIYLLRSDSLHWDIGKIVITPDHSLGVILIAQNGKDSCESIISESPDFPYTYFHEITEDSLIRKKEGISFEPDWQSKKLGFIKRTKINHTRWFREGFSTYCAWLAHETIISDSSFDRNQVTQAILHNGSHDHPFSALTKIGTKLFSWHQLSTFPPDTRPSPNLPTAQENMIEYYDASFGLFLLIRDRFGQDAICRIILGIDTLERADGPAIIKLTNKVLNTDIIQLVEDFHFPKTGLYMDPLFPGMGKFKNLSISEGCLVLVVESDSPAEKAGIRENDVIYRINDKDVKTNIDFELVIYEFMHQQNITVNIWRENVGEVVVDLNLSS